MPLLVARNAEGPLKVRTCARGDLGMSGSPSADRQTVDPLVMHRLIRNDAELQQAMGLEAERAGQETGKLMGELFLTIQLSGYSPSHSSKDGDSFETEYS